MVLLPYIICKETHQETVVELIKKATDKIKSSAFS